MISNVQYMYRDTNMYCMQSTGMFKGTVCSLQACSKVLYAVRRHVQRYCVQSAGMFKGTVCSPQACSKVSKIKLILLGSF